MGKGILFLLVLIVLVLIIGGVALFAMSTHSVLAFDHAPASIGTATPVNLRITNPHGIRSLTARIEQDGAGTVIHQVTRPATRFGFWRTKAQPETITFIAGKDRAPSLKEGKARLIVEVQSNDLHATTDSIAAGVDVILKPPSVTTDGFQHYINQGGSEMAVFTPSGSWQTAGVRVG